MGRVLALASAAVIFLAASPAAECDDAGPKLDKAKVESFLRYAEGITPNVKVVVDDAAASPFPGFYRLNVHLVLGSQKEDKTYYVSADGQKLINGALWFMNESPFADNLTRLNADGPAFGVADAKVTIIVFSDFECPYCQQLAKSLRANIPQKYPKDVRVVVKNYPIDTIHPWARAAAEAGACMAQQSMGAYWAYHDWMFDHQSAVDSEYKEKKAEFPAYLLDTAAKLAEGQKVDAAKVRSCMETHATAGQIKKDVAEGNNLMIARTPTFYIDGRPVDGAIPWASIDTLIKMELARVNGTPPGVAARVAP